MNTNKQTDAFSFFVVDGLLLSREGREVATWEGADLDAAVSRVLSRYEYEPSLVIPEITETEEEIVVDTTRGGGEDGVDYIAHVTPGDVIELQARGILREAVERRDLLKINEAVYRASKSHLWGEKAVQQGSPEYLRYLYRARQSRKALSLLERMGYTIFNTIVDQVIKDRNILEEDEKEIRDEIQRLRQEEPEILYPNVPLRARYSEILRDGLGKYRASQEREIEFSSGDDMRHWGQGLEPERVVEMEDLTYTIPYLRDGAGQVVLHKVPFMDPDSQKWVEKDNKSLAVYFLIRHNGALTVIPWVMVYEKYRCRLDLLQRELQDQKFQSYQMLCDSWGLPQKGALKELSQRCREIRALVRVLVYDLQRTEATDWGQSRGVLWMPKSNYFHRKIELLGKETRVYVQCLVKEN